MTSLLVEVPREGGLALAAEVYSPHLDLHQRLVVLDTLSAAALQMSTPPSRAKTALTMEVGPPPPPLYCICPINLWVGARFRLLESRARYISRREIPRSAP